jgi:hypothetical protein
MNTISNYVEYINNDAPTCRIINLNYNQIVDSNLTQLVDCLLIHPNVIIEIWLSHNQLTDTTGSKLARYVFISSNIKTLSLRYNHIGVETYIDVAAALRVNSSLQYLFLYNNLEEHKDCIDAAFIDALRLNPVRSPMSVWWLCSCLNEFEKLRDTAERATPPSMLEFLLCVHLNTEKLEKKTH